MSFLSVADVQNIERTRLKTTFQEGFQVASSVREAGLKWLRAVLFYTADNLIKLSCLKNKTGSKVTVSI